jgi:hypothetical protein
MQWKLQMNNSVNKIDAAVEQLDWSIKLFLYYRAFIPSITLAGASEEITGEAVENKTGTSSFHVVKDKLSKSTGISPKVITQEYLNKTKNWLKHWKSDIDAENIEVDLETESIHFIIRAMNNLVCYDKSVSSESPRFIKWLLEYRKDIYDGLSPSFRDDFIKLFKINL